MQLAVAGDHRMSVHAPRGGEVDGIGTAQAPRERLYRRNFRHNTGQEWRTVASDTPVHRGTSVEGPGTMSGVLDSEWKLICGTNNLLKLCHRALGNAAVAPYSRMAARVAA